MNRALIDIARKGTSCLAENLSRISATVTCSHRAVSGEAVRRTLSYDSGPRAAWLRLHQTKGGASFPQRQYGMQSLVEVLLQSSRWSPSGSSDDTMR